MSLTRTELFTGDLLGIRYVACSPSHTGIGDIEYSNADMVVLAVRGAFTKHFSPGAQVLAEPTQALFFAAGRPYRISHHETSGDTCLVLQFSPDALSDTIAARRCENAEPATFRRAATRCRASADAERVWCS